MKAIDELKGANVEGTSTEYLLNGQNRNESIIGQDVQLRALDEEMQYCARQ